MRGCLAENDDWRCPIKRFLRVATFACFAAWVIAVLCLPLVSDPGPEDCRSLYVRSSLILVLMAVVFILLGKIMRMKGVARFGSLGILCLFLLSAAGSLLLFANGLGFGSSLPLVLACVILIGGAQPCFSCAWLGVYAHANARTICQEGAFAFALACVGVGLIWHAPQSVLCAFVLGMLSVGAGGLLLSEKMPGFAVYGGAGSAARDSGVEAAGAKEQGASARHILIKGLVAFFGMSAIYGFCDAFSHFIDPATASSGDGLFFISAGVLLALVGALSFCSHVDERILSYRFLALYLVIGIMGASRLHLLMDVPESALLSAFLLLILLGIMACGDVSRHFGLEQAISACVGIAAVVCGDAAGSVAGLALSPLVTAHTSGVVEAAMMVSVIAVVTVRLFVFTEWDLAELFLGDGALLTADQVPLTAEEAAALISERSGLSERQQQVLPYLLRGDSMARIAQATSLSVSTVQTHAHNIYKKCGVRGKQDLILLFDNWQRRCGAGEDPSAEQ